MAGFFVIAMMRQMARLAAAMIVPYQSHVAVVKIPNERAVEFRRRVDANFAIHADYAVYETRNNAEIVRRY